MIRWAVFYPSPDGQLERDESLGTVDAANCYEAANVFIDRLNGIDASQELGVITMDRMLVLPIEQDVDNGGKAATVGAQIMRILGNAVRQGAASILRTVRQ